MAATNTSNLKLASAGEVVKIWDCALFKVCHILAFKKIPSFRSVHWSCDHNQVVYVPSDGEKLILSLIKPDAARDIELPIKSCITAQFSTTSPRVLGIGTKEGSVMIWDLKTQKCRKTFQSVNSEVTCLQFNWNDSYIASGFANGSVVLHNSNTGQSSAPLISKGVEKIESLQYSYSKKALIGCASQDGSVVLWDANTRQIINCFSDHVAPATGLRFSPANDLLLTSVGLDKRVFFYDIQSKKNVRKMDCDYPLTAVDFKEDGVTLAVGTTKGKIYFYDLRFCRDPSKIIDAHKTSVHSLAFQNAINSMARKIKPTNLDFSKLELSSMYTNNSTKDTKIEVPDYSPIYPDIETTKNYVNKMKVKKESLSSDIFSPLRDFSSSRESTRSMKNSTFFEKDRLSFFSPVQGPKGSSDLTMSNIAEEDSFIDSEGHAEVSSNARKVQPPSELSAKSNSLFADPFHPKEKNESFKQQILKAALSPQSAVPTLGICSRSGDCSSAMWSCSPADPGTSKPDAQDEKIVLQQPKLLEAVSVASGFGQPSSNLKDLERQPDISADKSSHFLGYDCSDLAVDEGKGTSKSTTPLTPQGFQSEFLRQLIVDAMEEHADNLRKDFYQLHVRMVREFEQQREQMEELFSTYLQSSEHIQEPPENCFWQDAFR